ncbi:MAG TPA: hypothetical protein VE174_01700, partial [Actinomycetota bacterium]|nr:hypothetical protein [Actinomycetota bacterium]
MVKRLAAAAFALAFLFSSSFASGGETRAHRTQRGLVHARSHLQRHDLSFWTPARMRKAKPLPMPAVRAPSRKQVVPRSTGPAASIEGMSVETGRAPSVGFDAGTRFHGAPILAPSRTAGPIPYTSYEATTDYTQYPYSTFGKIFMIFDGEYFVCSGTSIVSDNKSLVWSAGHCVYDVRNGFVEDLIFVPAYKDGEAPFGVFPIYDAIVPPGWTDNGNWADDQAAIVVGPNEDGEFLNDAVGSLGLEWNVDPIDFTAIG